MKTLIRVFFLVLITIFYFGCNSTIYEIVEVEEPIEIKPEKSPTADIKEDITELPTENKFTDKQMVSKTFAIQIGAFNNEENASNFTDNAKNVMINPDIYFKNIDGLYKVRMGNFSSKFDALNYLEMLKQRGFADSFIVELTYYKVEK